MHRSLASFHSAFSSLIAWNWKISISSSAVSLWLLSLRSGVLGIAGTINAGGAVGAVTHEVVGILIDDSRLSRRQIYIRVIFETLF